MLKWIRYKLLPRVNQLISQIIVIDKLLTWKFSWKQLILKLNNWMVKLIIFMLIHICFEFAYKLRFYYVEWWMLNELHGYEYSNLKIWKFHAKNLTPNQWLCYCLWNHFIILICMTWTRFEVNLVIVYLAFTFQSFQKWIQL